MLNRSFIKVQRKLILSLSFAVATTDKAKCHSHYAPSPLVHYTVFLDVLKDLPKTTSLARQQAKGRFTTLTTTSANPGLLDMTFFAHWLQYS